MLVDKITNINKAGLTQKVTSFNIHSKINGFIVLTKENYYIGIDPIKLVGEFFFLTNENVKEYKELPLLQQLQLNDIWGDIEWITEN